MKHTPSTRHNPQPKTWQKRVRCVLKWIGIGIVSLIAVAVLGLIIRAVVVNANSKRLKKELTSQVEDARPSALTTSNTKHQDILDFLSRSTTLNDEPVYSVVYDSCYSDHNDSGWFANSYNYRCVLSYVDIFEADISEELRAKVRTKTERFEQTDKDIWDMYHYTSVLDLVKPSTLLTYNDLEPYPRLEASIPLPLPSVNIRELATSRAILFNSIVAYAAREAHDSKLLVSERGSADFDPAKTYVIVSWDNRYFDRNIGCAFGRIVFCDSPLEPVDIS